MLKLFTYIDRHEADESESSGPSLVIRDEIDLVDVAVLREVTLKVATRRRVAENVENKLMPHLKNIIDVYVIACEGDMHWLE